MSQKLQTIREQWDSFDAAVLPKGCSALQRQEVRRAFYAGAQSVLALFTDIGGDDVSEDEGVVRLERFHEECRQFGRDIQEGRA
jgi:hypothetical protein